MPFSTVGKPSGQSWELIKTIFYAVLLATVFRSFAYEPFHIPSGSMKTNLLVGDYIFVSKYSYGYSRFSFPFGRLMPYEGRTGDSLPERGDIVVFRLPTDPSIDYIKRVIGLPGDRIEVKGGIVNLNGEMIPRTRVEDYIETQRNGTEKRIRQFRETLPEGRSYLVLDDMPCMPVGNDPERQACSKADKFPYRYIVPKGHYFMMGDNRDHSTDSRYLEEVGYVPAENIIGRAEIIAFSGEQSDAKFWEIWEWITDFRGERFMKALH